MGKASKSGKGAAATGSVGFDGVAGGGRPAQVAEPKPGAGVPGASAGPRATVTHEQIARRAYELYLERCQRGLPGTPESDWKRAEAELRQG